VTLPYAGKPIDPRTVGRELNVRYVADGELRRVGERIVVSARLVDAMDGRQTWSDRIETSAHDRTTTDLDVSQRLVYRLNVAVRDAEITRARADSGNRRTSIEFVLRGNAVAFQGYDVVKDARESRKLYDQALAIDPNFVPALIGRGQTFIQELTDDPAADWDRLVPELENVSRRALSLDADDAGVWLLRGDALSLQGRGEGALEAFGRAGHLDPSLVAPLVGQAWRLMYMGRFGDAIQMADRAIAKDKLHGYTSDMLRLKCRCNIALGRLDEAIADCEKSSAGADNRWLHAHLLAAYAGNGDATRARAEKARLFEQWPGASVVAITTFWRHYTDAPEFWEPTDRIYIPGLRKGGLPE
jgi:tetratricopeptide (TPR) repeat protein